jgi:hypothetical protein
MGGCRQGRGRESDADFSTYLILWRKFVDPIWGEEKKLKKNHIKQLSSQPSKKLKVY